MTALTQTPQLTVGRDQPLEHLVVPRIRHRVHLLQLLRDRDGLVSGSTAEGGDEEVVEALTALALEPLDGDLLPGYAEEVWARLQEFLLRRRSSALRQELQKMNPVTDPRYDEMFQRLISADGELRRLRERSHDAASLAG